MKSYKISLREKELNSIRNNSSAVKLIFPVCSHIANLSIADLYFDIPTNPLPYVVLYISDSMNRLIWENENRQLHSIHFPFFVSDNGSFLKLHYHGIEIDSQAIQALTRLFISEDLQVSFDGLFEEFLETTKEFDLSSLRQQEIWVLYQYLCSFEVGYLRYDYDPEHEDGQRHPLHHLDINFSNACTYKIGLTSNMEVDAFVDLLNLETDCKYISLN